MTKSEPGKVRLVVDDAARHAASLARRLVRRTLEPSAAAPAAASAFSDAEKNDALRLIERL